MGLSVLGLLPRSQESWCVGPRCWLRETATLPMNLCSSSGENYGHRKRKQAGEVWDRSGSTLLPLRPATSKACQSRGRTPSFEGMCLSLSPGLVGGKARCYERVAQEAHDFPGLR